MGTHLIQKEGTAAPPPFSAHVLWPNGWMDQDAIWYRGRPQPRPHSVRWGPSSLARKRGQSPQFLAHVYCGQMAGWNEMPFGTEVDLSPGHIVLDGDPSPPAAGKGHSSPLSFRPMFMGEVWGS